MLCVFFFISQFVSDDKRIPHIMTQTHVRHAPGEIYLLFRKAKRPRQSTRRLIDVDVSYQLVESLEAMLASSKTKAMIDERHFIQAFISLWLSAEWLFTGPRLYGGGGGALIYCADKKKKWCPALSQGFNYSNTFPFYLLSELVAGH